MLLLISACPQPGLDAMGARKPSPIQAAAIPRVLSGANCAVQSYTGSGKVGRDSDGGTGGAGQRVGGVAVMTVVLGLC